MKIKIRMKLYARFKQIFSAKFKQNPKNVGADFEYYSRSGEITESSIGSADSTSTISTTITISGLIYNSTYFWGIKAFDGENYSILTTTTPYYTPLPPISDLNAGTSAIREAIDLFWSSNGAKSYLIKFAEKEIVESEANENQINWEDANLIENSLIPQVEGKIESFTVKNLTPNITYYFAVKSINQADAASIVSNSAKAKALPGFQDNGDETVTDLYTGLIWVKDGTGLGSNDGQPLTWDEAKTFCEQLNFAGYDDWRLPNFKELASIINYGQNAPYIDKNYFPNTFSSSYWTSSYKYTPGMYCAGNYCAYPASWEIRIIDFNNGTILQEFT